MSSKTRFAHFMAVALISVMVSVFVFPARIYALEEPNSVLPNLPSFIEAVKDGNPGTPRGIYVPGVMAYNIVQQPVGNANYVSADAAAVTEFRTASAYGNLGLLAHNDLAGSAFSQIKVGDTILIVYGDGHVQRFLVKSSEQYQALQPLDPYGNFQELETGNTLTAVQLFNRVYNGNFHLTLQTCIEKDGNLSWGRLFIIAVPINGQALNALRHNRLGLVDIK